jgi:hypothetical protein
VTGTSLTVKSSSGELTFAVDDKTSIIGTGVGTKSREMKTAGKKTVITDFIGVGDTVDVSYHEMEGAKHAAQVRLRRKAK